MTVNNTNSALNKVAAHPLQTTFWADFRREWGNEVLETGFGILTLHKLPFTNFKIGIFEKGPMPTAEMLATLQKVAKENGAVSIKLEPNYAVKKGGMLCADRKKAVALLRKHGAVPGKTLFTPTTFWIDLTKSEEELLASFHPKTRYNIRYAERKGVKVVNDNSDKAFETYLQLMRQTVERQGFYAHSEKYHRLMWKHLGPAQSANSKEQIAHLLLAKHGSDVLTAWIVFVWKDFLYYPYGAWSGQMQNLQPNSAMMWEAIKFGKEKGLKTFDLWGREEGKGFTRFKEGFNPEVVEFLGSWDLVVNFPVYWAYRVAEAIRWPILRLRGKLTKPSF